MDKEALIQELTYRTARSSGSGGQHVNKVETKVEALLDVQASAALSEAEKAIVSERLAGKLSAEGLLSVTCQTERSQLKNKLIAQEKMAAMIEKALTPVKKRTPTRMPRAAKAAIKKEKATRSVVKSLRRRPNVSDDGQED